MNNYIYYFCILIFPECQYKTIDELDKLVRIYFHLFQFENNHLFHMYE